MLMVAPSGMVKDEIRRLTPIFFLQRVDIHRDSGVRGCGRERKAHNRSEFLEETQRIESCKQRQQNLVYAAALDEQCQQHRAHVLEHWHHSGETKTGKGLSDQAEYADRRKTHDHHGHFHHNIVALLEEVRYQLGLILQLGEDNADDQCKHDNLQHFAVGERTDRVFRDDVQQGFRKADRIRRSGDFGGLDLRHIQTHARLDQKTDTECNGNRHHRGENVKADDLYADLAERFTVADGGGAADQRAEYQRYDQHLHQADKALTDNIKNAVYQHVLHKIHISCEHVERNADDCTGDQRDEDPCSQTDFLFLFYFIHLFTPVCRWDMYSLSASCQSGI